MKKFLFFSIVALTAIGYYRSHQPNTEMNKLTSAFQKDEAPDEFIRIANQKTDRVLEIADLIKYDVTVRGRIIRALDWHDFPGLADEVAKLHPDGQQLLQVSVGEPALLVTRKTSFSTTGQFYLNAQKYTKWKTTMGEVWVLVEYPEGKELMSEWNQIRKDLKELSLQYLEQKIPEYQTKAAQLKKDSKSDFEEHTLASLLFVEDLGTKKGKASNIFVYTFAKDLTLCLTKKEYTLDANLWKKEFAKVFTNKNISRDIVSCANGGPFQSGEKLLTFGQCMCGGQDSDPFLVSDKNSRARFAKISETFGNQRSVAKPDTKLERKIANDLDEKF